MKSVRPKSHCCLVVLCVLLCFHFMFYMRLPYVVTISDDDDNDDDDGVSKLVSEIYKRAQCQQIPNLRRKEGAVRHYYYRG